MMGVFYFAGKNIICIFVFHSKKITDMKKTSKLDVWVISRISVFLNESIGGEQGSIVEWYMNDGSQIQIDFDRKEINFIDWVGDDKTYYSIVGVASMAEFTTNDCYTDK